jgi:hypothetical protein
MKMKCSECKFWNYEEDLRGVRIGTCRKRSPSLDNEARWPAVSEAEFCHEFEELLETKDDLCHDLWDLRFYTPWDLRFYTPYTGTDLLQKIEDCSSIKWADGGEHPTEWSPDEDEGVVLILDKRSTELYMDDYSESDSFLLTEEAFIQECSRRCPRTD